MVLERMLARVSAWVLDHVKPQWVHYVVSNTMTDVNRWLNGFLWTYDLKALLVAVEDEAPDVKTFVLQPNQHWRGCQSGQHVEVCLPIEGADGGLVRRHYSISSWSEGRLRITVKRLQDGVASRWMHAQWHPGMWLTLGMPQGRFLYQEQPKVLYLCAGSGITPCHSMVAALLARPVADRPDIQVVAQFRHAEDVIFKPALTAWAQKGVKVTTLLSSEVSRLDAPQLQRLCPDVLTRDVYLCGPTGFMAQMMAHLEALQVDLRRVHTERFVMAEPTVECAANFEAEGAEVYFEHINARIVLTAKDQGKTLLRLADEHGLNLESGCGKGMCGTCRLTVHEGMVSGNVLGRAVSLCTAYPASRVVVLGA